MCSHEHESRGEAILSLQCLPCLPGKHTATHKMLYWCLVVFRTNYTNCIVIAPQLVDAVHSHKWKSGHGLSKGPLTTEISGFIILHVNLLFFFLCPAGVPDKNEQKNKFPREKNTASSPCLLKMSIWVCSVPWNLLHTLSLPPQTLSHFLKGSINLNLFLYCWGNSEVAEKKAPEIWKIRQTQHSFRHRCCWDEGWVPVGASVCCCHLAPSASPVHLFSCQQVCVPLQRSALPQSQYVLFAVLSTTFPKCSL